MPSRSSRNKPVLVIGLGNVLLMDDGVGVHAVHLLLRNPPPGTLIVEVGTAILDALHLLEQADRVLAIDAMQAGGKPGTIYAFGPDDVEDCGVQASLHELGLRSALHLLPNKQTPEIRILGVEPARIDFSMELTPAVQAALPHLEQAARALIASWPP